MSHCNNPTAPLATSDRPATSHVLRPRTWLAAVMAIAVLQASPLLGQEKAQSEPKQKGGPWMYVADADGSNMKLLTDLPEYPYQGSPCWSGNGKLVAFDATKPGSSESQIVVVNADGSNPRVLIDGAMPSFSPAGKRFAFSRSYPNQGVWVASVEGPEKELVLLDENGWGADWSPDGTKIAYTASTIGGANLVVFNLVEGERQYLFPEENSPYLTIKWNFCWSPDSKRIVFHGVERNNKVLVGMVDARGAERGHTTRVVDGVWAAFSWRPDGKAISLTKHSSERKRSQLFLLDPDSNEPPTLLPGQTPNAANVNAAFSPDGKRILICSYQTPPKDAIKKQ